MNLTVEKVSPFFPAALRSDDRLFSWLTAIQVLLNARYGERITTEQEPLFLDFVAEAIIRRSRRPRGMVDQESIGPASVRWNPRALLSRWFLEEELTQMDAVLGAGGIQSVRMPAPDSIRYGNLTGITEDYF